MSGLKRRQYILLSASIMYGAHVQHALKEKLAAAWRVIEPKIFPVKSGMLPPA